MLLEIIKKIPFVGSLFCFQPSILGRSLGDLVLLWVFSSIPVIFSILPLLLKEEGTSLAHALASVMDVKLLLVYTSSFLAPVIVLLINRLVYPRKEKIFSGVWWVASTAIIILLFSAWTFGNPIFKPDGRDMGAWTIFSVCIYFISIYLWFLSIADENNDSMDYESVVAQEENSFADKAASGKR